MQWSDAVTVARAGYRIATGARVSMRRLEAREVEQNQSRHGRVEAPLCDSKTAANPARGRGSRADRVSRAFTTKTVAEGKAGVCASRPRTALAALRERPPVEATLPH
jgi:hypothetical protein